MKQILAKSSFNVGFGGATLYLPIQSGHGTWATSAALGEEAGQVPMAAAGVLQNLVVRLPTAQANTVTFTLRKNGASTAIVVALLAGATTGSDVVNTVSVVAGDLIDLMFTGTSGAGFPANFYLEFVSSTTNLSAYGIGAASGSLSSNPVGTNSYVGGAFGNGEFQTIQSVALSLSNTYSIVPTAGTMTHMRAAVLSGVAPGAGTWTVSVRKNNITQDGTGGTVNTTFTITGVATTGSKTFTLPLVAGDHVDVLVTRSGTDAAFANAQVAVGTTFVSTADGEFLCCGGNNDSISSAATGYEWNWNEQLIANENAVQAPAGPSGFYVTAFYVERSAAPGNTKSWAHTFRVNGVASELVVAVANLATSGSDSGSVLIAPDDLLSIQTVPTGTPSSSQLHWSFLATTGATPIPPVPSGDTFLTRRVRRFPHASQKQVWLFWDRLQIDIQAGTALASGQGSDPQIMLRWSDDGGHTWSHEHWQSAGLRGQYGRRAMWRKLGRSRDRVYEMVVTDPVKWVFLQALAVIREGRS